MKKITLLMLFFSTVWGYSQVKSYAFTQSNGTYAEITSGTVLGNASSDQQYFVDPALPLGTSAVKSGPGFPIGFNFIFNGSSYDRFAVNNNGWIALGSTAYTPSVNATSTNHTNPINATDAITPDVLSAKIAVLGCDLQAQAGAELSFTTTGSAPNRVLTVQWKNYRRATVTGDLFNFQLKLYETANTIDFVYGSFTGTYPLAVDCAVGLRAEPSVTASNFISRKSTSSWSGTTAGTASTDIVKISSSIKPASGLTFSWTPPACLDPKVLVSSTIGTNSATLTWGTSLPAPSGGYEYMISTSATAPTGSGTATNVTTVTKSDLVPNTQYNMFVRALCGTVFTQWVLVGTFKTECLDITAFTENFDSYTAGSTTFPGCWTKISTSGATAYIDSGSAAPGSAPNRLYMLPNSSIPSTVYAVLPNMNNLQAGTHRLRFKAYAATANKTFDVGYFTNVSDLNSFNIVKTITLPSTTAAAAIEYMVVPPTLPQGVKNLVFRNSGTGGGPGTAAISIDDVIWQPIPACTDVKNVAVKLPTSNSVQLTWDSTGTETAWQYIYGPSAVVDPYSLPQTSVVDVNLKTATVGDLTPGTSYKIWVRSNCGNGSYGFWTESPVFLMPCQSADSLVEDFDASLALPNCWHKAGNSGSVSVASSVGNSSSNALVLTTTSASDAVFAAIPSVSTYATSGYRFRFKYKSLHAGGSLQIICYKDPMNFDPNDPTSYTVLKTLTASAANNVYSCSEALGASATPHLGFRFSNTLASSMYIDDFAWELGPTCPDVTEVVVNGIKGGSVDLGWTAGGSESNWQYAITDSKAADPNALQAKDFDFPSLNGGVVTGRIPNLTASTAYKFWIRSNCSAASTGAWVGPFYFTTNCPSTAGFFQSFDVSANFPNCWSKVGTGGSAAIAQFAGTSIPNVLRIDGSTTSKSVVAMQPVSNSGDGSNILRFKLSGTAGAKVEVGYMTNPQDPSKFFPLKTFTVSSTTAFSSEYADLGYEPASEVLAFRNPGISAGNSIIYIDDVVWEPIPPCPDVTAIALPEITNATVGFSWNKGAGENAWQYVLGNPTVSDPKTLTAVNFVSPVAVGSNVTGTIGGLTASTSYKVWIRSKCSGSSFGSWIGPISFTTTCAQVETITEKFDANTNIPDCWTKVGTAGTVSVVALGGAPSSSNALSLVSTSTAKAVVAVRPVSNAGTGTYRLRFKFSSTIPDGIMYVGYLTNNADPSSFNLLESLSATAANVFYSKIVELGTNPASGILAFRNPDASTVYLDDVFWEPIPACLDVTSVTPILASSNTLNLSWKPSGSETAWQYAVGLSTDSDPNALTPVDFVAPTSTAANVAGMVSGLMPSTSYKIWVRSKCDGSYGVWSDPASFATICDPIEVFSQNFDATTAFPPCWSKVGAQGAVQINAIPGTPSVPNVLYMYASGFAGNAFAAMPPVSNAQAGTHRLKFKFRSSIAGSTLEVGYLKLIKDPNSFVPLNSYKASSTTAYDNIVCDLGIAPASQVLAFRNAPSDGNATIIYIDDVVWEPKPPCPEVKNLAVTSIAGTTLSLSWTKGDSETMWQYALGGVADSNPAALNAVDVPFSQTSPTALTISNLSPSMVYNVWVRSKCDASSGAWIGPLNVATNCNPIADFTQNFDSNMNMPDCWRKVGLSGGIAVSALAGASSPNVLDLNSATGTAIVAMPPVSNAAAGTHRLKFKFRSNVANGTVEVGYVTNVADQASFVPLESYASSSTTAFNSKTVTLGTKPGSGILAFRNPATLQSHIYIDDVVWEPIPNCTDVVNVAVKLPTTNSVQLSWDSTGTETVWQYAYASPTVADPNSLPAASIYDTASKVVTVGGLDPNTSYKIWVRSKCADGLYGYWTESPTFFTPCTSVEAITQNFDAGLALPECWHKVGTKGSVSVVSAAGTYSPNALELKTAAGIDNAVYVAIPPLSTAKTGTYRMKFRYKSSDANCKLEIVCFKDPINLNGLSSFTVLKSIMVSSGNNVYDVNELLPVADTPYLGLRFYNMNTSGTGTLYVDDFVWEPLPVATCATGIIAKPNINCGNYATLISWPAGDGAAGYKLTVGTTSGASNVVNNLDLGNVLSYSVAGNSNTTYYYTLKPYNILGEAVGCAEKTFATKANTCYCPSVPTSNDGSGITNVKIGASDFTNADVTYKDFTSKAVNLAQGAFSNLKVSFNILPVYYNLNIWIDFDNNYVFDPSEIVFTGNSAYADSNNVLSASFMMPAHAPLGMHGMRIVATSTAQEQADPCYSGGHGVTLDFNVNIVVPAVNDEPAGAAALTPGNVFATNAVTGTNADSTGSFQVADPGCGNYDGMDVWYKAVVPASGKLTFEVNGISGGLTNTAAAAYSGSSDSLTLISCDDSGSPETSGAGGDHPKIDLVGRTPGEVLYFRVWENGGDAFGSFYASAYDSNALSVDAFETNNFAYYPNPVKDILNLSMNQEIANVAVFNLLGQEVINQSANGNQARIDMSNLSKGAYLVKVISNNQSKTIKVVKE